MAFKTLYQNEIAPAFAKERGLKNRQAVPRVTKVTLNVGLGQGIREAKYLDAAEQTLRRISGQQPVKTRARISISNFKIRKGMIIGMKVTLRGKRMWDFLEKLVKVALPRVRDFRGLPSTLFDRQGNLSIGFREHTAFPEIRPEEIETIHGVQVTVTTTARRKEDGQQLLKLFGFPFREEPLKSKS
ncbi:MAG TPA: 50S ribosomal protein L5 [Patescibacteria group bacterium]|nr:50S ribosomal protein L5 [Patescibacteria group bacterium]